MLGWLIGTACLFGLIELWRGPRCGRGGSWEPGCGGWRERCAHGGRGRRLWLRALFERLDTTPGQERVIVQAIDDVLAKARAARAALEQTRHDVAEALRAGTFDEGAMGAVFARHDAALREIRAAFAAAFARVTDALDETQRRRLADLVERGLAGPASFGGPYRGRASGACA